MDPVKPEDITFVDVKSDSVIIQWTVPYISYSPETYVVHYGTSRDSLIHNSSSTDSEEEVMTYSVELSGLRDNTTYYVQVLATNTAQRSNRSTVYTHLHTYSFRMSVAEFSRYYSLLRSKRRNCMYISCRLILVIT